MACLPTLLGPEEISLGFVLIIWEHVFGVFPYRLPGHHTLSSPFHFPLSLQHPPWTDTLAHSYSLLYRYASLGLSRTYAGSRPSSLLA